MGAAGAQRLPPPGADQRQCSLATTESNRYPWMWPVCFPCHTNDGGIPCPCQPRKGHTTGCCPPEGHTGTATVPIHEKGLHPHRLCHPRAWGVRGVLVFPSAVTGKSTLLPSLLTQEAVSHFSLGSHNRECALVAASSVARGRLRPGVVLLGVAAQGHPHRAAALEPGAERQLPDPVPPLDALERLHVGPGVPARRADYI